ncbi:MAG: hypothetical protein SH821_09475 [Phototrophicales bacterium]|nr:hypothetical protein [Phototrophicales bacterium]
MKRLIIFTLFMLTLGACSPPVNLNKVAQANNRYGTYTVAYSERWFIDVQFGRVAFSTSEEGLEAYLVNAPVTGESTAGAVFVLPKGENLDTLEAVINTYQESLLIPLSNREAFSENDKSGLSAIGSQTISNIAVDVGVVVSDLGNAFGVVVYYTSAGKVNTSMNSARRMSSTIAFVPNA